LVSREISHSQTPVDKQSRAEPSFFANGLEVKNMRDSDVTQLDGGNKDDSSS
jgi:hypothetical protein